MALVKRRGKSENLYFPCFLTAKNPRVNKRTPGGIFLKTLADVDVFGASFWGVQFHRLSALKRHYMLQKRVVSTLFGRRRNE